TPAYGDVVRVRGTARPLAAATNPGEFDGANWLRRRGVHFEITTRSESDCAMTGEARGAKWMHFAIAARAWVKARLEVGLEDAPELTTLIESMVLGLRGETPPEMKGLFQKTGTLHLFAVSGLNVAMLAGIAWYLLKPLRFSRAAACFVILPLLLAYAIVTGLSASCVRATVMAGFVLAAPLFERPAVPLNSLAAAAATILAWDTNQLFTPGFQLSFVLVLFIMGLTGPIARRMEPMARPDDFLPEELWNRGQRIGVGAWKKFAQATGVTVSAWLGSFAFMAGYFHLISPVAIVANAVAVPLAFCVLALGLMSLLPGPFGGALPAIVNQANWLVANALLYCLALFAKVPGGHLYVEVPRLERPPECEVTVLDVGEGSAIHVRGGGGDWLLDCGGARDYGNTVLPYLRSRGVNRLDGLVLTHGDSAHLGAATLIFDDFRPRWIADTTFQDRSPSRREVHAKLAASGFGRRYFERGDEVPIAPGTSVTVLYPPAGIARSVSDDKAMVCRIEAAGLRVLCVSDAGFFTETWLVENEPDLRADVLVKGWHTADLSGTPDFLAKVRPSVIVSSEMPFGSAGGQGTALEEAARGTGAALFRQERCGAVRIRLRAGGELEVSSFVGGQVFRSRAR
ncbi:MAG: ComEC/Rec2 family competence protein, partial [Chthoniobacteraceae bacterium]